MTILEQSLKEIQARGYKTCEECGKFYLGEQCNECAPELPQGAKKTIEKARRFWTGVAKANGWYTRPFFVQVWLQKDGQAFNSVSFKGMTGDIILVKD